MTNLPTGFVLVDAEIIQKMDDRLKRMEECLSRVQITPRDEWVTVSEYSRIVGRTTRTVRNWISAGSIETKRCGGVLMVRR